MCPVITDERVRVPALEELPCPVEETPSLLASCSPSRDLNVARAGQTGDL